MKLKNTCMFSLALATLLALHQPVAQADSVSSFTCSDYYGHTKLSVSYAHVAPESAVIKGTFTLKSDSLSSSGEVSGTFFNYAGEPSNFALDDLKCNQPDGSCLDESGKFLSAGHDRFNLTFDGVEALVFCEGDLP